MPGGVGGVLGALDVGAAELVGALGLGGQLVADGEADLDGRGVRAARIRSLTAVSMVSPGRCWQIGARCGCRRSGTCIRGSGAVAGVVADGHPPAAPAADDEALQQGGAFAGRPGCAVVAAGGGVGGQDGQVGLVLVPGEVPGVVVFDQDRPFPAGPGGGVVVPVQVGGVAGPAVGVGAGVGGVVQDA